MRAKRRFRDHGASFVGVKKLPPDSPAIQDSRTLYRARVAEPGPEMLFKSGEHSRKIGKTVTKGPWAGMPIYTLTLEERATCPRDCQHWTTCLAPESRVLKSDLTWTPLGSLVVGDRIAAFDEDGGHYGHRMTRIAIVEATARITQPAYEIETDRVTVIASVGHQWLIRRDRFGYRWRPTTDLKVGDRLPFFAQPWETARSYEAGRLRGFVEGEGYCLTDGGARKKPRTGWAQRPTALMQEIIDTAHQLGFKTARRNLLAAGAARNPVSHADIVGGWREVCRFIGTIRPTRMIEKAEALWAGQSIAGRGAQFATVRAVRFVGEREVVSIKTSTNTMVADGLFTHNCFGNKMNWSTRWEAGPDLERALERDLMVLSTRHPGGFVVRLHVLGDFYSIAYAAFWEGALVRHPGLRVFGYTARDPEADPIGRRLDVLARTRWDRFAMRFSNRWRPDRGALTLWRPGRVPASVGIVCPAQTGQTDCCGTCGLCWNSRINIFFELH